MEIKDRIEHAINQSKGLVVLRSEFSGMGSSSQVGRALARLVANGMLVRVSKGAYAKARINQYTGAPTPAGTLEVIAAELFKKLDIQIFPNGLVQDYNSGRTTQIPMGTVVNTGGRRITRKIFVGGNVVIYER